MTTKNEAALHGEVSASWRSFLATYEPLRPDLYRYCRHLARSPWDAEDMVQETLARAFVNIGLMAEPPKSARGWLFRVASNLWLNRVRDTRELPGEVPEPAASSAGEPRAVREAAGTLFAQLSPQERAAIVLKQAFDLTLDEIAEALATTPGAIKAALHRGRTKLVVPGLVEPAPVAPAVLDAFAAAFNARDLDRLTALLVESATMEYPGFKIESGAAAVRAGTLKGVLLGCPEAGYEVVVPPRCEVRAHRGESLLLWWSGDEVHSVVRAWVVDDTIVRLASYFHAPEVLAEVCRELEVPFRTHGYRPEGVTP